MKNYKNLTALFCFSLLTSCSGLPKHERPLSPRTQDIMSQKGLSAYQPILIRIFKKEETLEVWKRHNNGTYMKLRSWDICAYSGDIGPKLKEGDRQAPEGFYDITPGLMNPWSNFHLAFNLGFPNSFDKSHNRTGSHLMVHGDCSSRGCYAMRDGPMEDIYGLGREAFKGGQKKFQVQAYPFRLTEKNMEKYKDHKWIDYWKNLKVGYDAFEQTKQPPKVHVCEKKYVFNLTDEQAQQISGPADSCPADLDMNDDIANVIAL